MDNRGKYRLVYAAKVFEDLDGILTHIKDILLAPESAAHVIQRIDDAILQLPAFPYRMPLARDTSLAQKGFRLLTVENFVVLYIVDDEAQIVSIHRVVYAKRNFRWLIQ